MKIIKKDTEINKHAIGSKQLLLFLIFVEI